MGQDPIWHGDRNRNKYIRPLQKALSIEVRFYLGRVRTYRSLWKKEWGRRRL